MYSQHCSIIWPVWLNGWVFVCELSGCGFKSRCTYLNFGYGTCFERRVSSYSGKYRVRIDSETRTSHDKNIQLNQPYRKNYSQHNSIIWPVWLNVRVFVCELSGYGFESRCSFLTCRCGACFKQRVPWHWSKYTILIHSETRTWLDKNIKSNAPYRKLLTTQPNHWANLAKWLSVRLKTKMFWVRFSL